MSNIQAEVTFIDPVTNNISVVVCKATIQDLPNGQMQLNLTQNDEKLIIVKFQNEK